MAGRTWARAAVAAASVGLLAGCAALPAAPAAQAPIPLASAWHPGLFVDGHGPVGLGPSASAGASDPSLADPDQQQLATVGLLTSDVTGGATVALATNGTSLSVPTLHYCAASFPSEKARVARRRLEVLDPSGAPLHLSSEAVLYRTAADATTALAELRSAVARCPARRSITFSSHDLVVTQVPAGDVPTAGLVPASDRQVVSTQVHDVTAGVTYRDAGVYQVYGRVLCVVLLSSAGEDFTTLELETLHDVARASAVRLARLDPAYAQAS